MVFLIFFKISYCMLILYFPTHKICVWFSFFKALIPYSWFWTHDIACLKLTWTKKSCIDPNSHGISKVKWGHTNRCERCTWSIITTNSLLHSFDFFSFFYEIQRWVYIGGSNDRHVSTHLQHDMIRMHCHCHKGGFDWGEVQHCNFQIILLNYVVFPSLSSIHPYKVLLHDGLVMIPLSTP